MAQTTLVTDVPLSLTRATYNPEKEQDFYENSISPHTRKAYLRVLREFFRTVQGLFPQEVTPRHVLAWRELLVKRRQKPNTTVHTVRLEWQDGLAYFHDTKGNKYGCAPDTTCGGAYPVDRLRLCLSRFG